MKTEKLEFLQLTKSVPARVTVAEAAWMLGFAEHDMPILVATRLLKPLGRPAMNGGKFFAAVELEELRRDVKWLSRASEVITNHWKRKNANQRARQISEPVSTEAESNVSM